MSDLISRQYVLSKFNNGIFKAITNADGLSAIDIVQNAPDAFQVEDVNKLGTTNGYRIRNMDNVELSEYLMNIYECGFLSGEGHIVEVCDGCEFSFCFKDSKVLEKWLESEVKHEDC